MNILELIETKKKLIIVVLTVILLIMITVIFILSRNNNQVNPEIIPSPSTNPSTQISPGENGLVPTDILTTPLPNTGALLEELPQSEIDIINQERALRKRSPYNGVTFIITYNYNTDLFDVTLNEPREQAQTDFQTWIQQNYPAIVTDRFLIQ